MKIPTKDAFSAIYKSFIGKDRGPRAAWFLLQYPKDKVVQRLKEVIK
jgi:lysyl-tRNA synthetase class I